MQREFIALQCVSQAPFEGYASCDALVEFGRREHDALAGRLGVAQRDLGATEQRSRVVAITGVKGNPDMSSEPHLLPVQCERFSENLLVEPLLHRECRGFACQCRKDDRIHSAADVTGADSLGQLVAQAVRELPQKLIAAVAAQRMVDLNSCRRNVIISRLARPVRVSKCARKRR